MPVPSQIFSKVADAIDRIGEHEFEARLDEINKNYIGLSFLSTLISKYYPSFRSHNALVNFGDWDRTKTIPKRIYVYLAEKHMSSELAKTEIQKQMKYKCRRFIEDLSEKHPADKEVIENLKKIEHELITEFLEKEIK